MRLFLVPLIVYAVAPSAPPPEPSERAMRIAFEQRLQVQVDNVLEFLSETSGPQVVARLRESGMDRFEVRTFKKLDCAQDDAGFRCSFEVDVSLVTGMIGQKISGRFMSGPDGRLTFAQDI